MILLTILCLVICALAFLLGKGKVSSAVPEYVLTYAPIVYLDSSDWYRPADIRSQLTNTQPEVNFTVASRAPNPLTLDNLNALNVLGGLDGTDFYLTSRNNIENNPTWLCGTTPDERGKTTGAVSCAIIVNDHGSGLVDAFYMYFYAFNYGGDYVGHIVGNHVGDWEYNMVRFKNGTPQAIWYSQHNNGEAFEYSVVEKYNHGHRPVCYSANGTHANYAFSGTHGHGIPNVNLPDGPIDDYTNKGLLWDPTLSAYYYKYDAASQSFSAYDDITPVNWLYFEGSWGDEQYPDSDARQEGILGIDGLYKYVSGPTGPIAKQLNRTDVCPENGNACWVRPFLWP